MNEGRKRKEETGKKEDFEGKVIKRGRRKEEGEEDEWKK